MSLVATLICDPRHACLDSVAIGRARDAVATRAQNWLADAVACDLDLDPGTGLMAADAALRTALAGLPVDVVVQEKAGRRKRLLIADMDSTMIGQECIDELAAMVGLKDHVAAITARAMNGEIAFETALRERVALLKGLPVSVVDDVIRTRITLAPGGLELIRTMKAAGGYTALVSGGFTAFTGPVAAQLGFDEHRANVLEEEAGILTGAVREPILGREAKANALAEHAAKLGISVAQAIAVGDGANDLSMLALAGSGVALHAKPAVAAQVRMRIDHGDLTALLYIQGYRQSDFAA
jgi:phosphoserine phosphatase